jgi:ribosomal protein L9
VIHAFFLGRALAEVLTEKVEDTFTNALSELGKFDAEQREKLRELVEEVQARAEKEAQQGTGVNGNGAGAESEPDLQETIDELRADIARLKAELKNYRDQNP